MPGITGPSARSRRGKRTVTQIQPLEETDRLEELASMLRGEVARRNDATRSRRHAGGGSPLLVKVVGSRSEPVVPLAERADHFRQCLGLI